MVAEKRRWLGERGDELEREDCEKGPPVNPVRRTPNDFVDRRNDTRSGQRSHSRNGEHQEPSQLALDSDMLRRGVVSPPPPRLPSVASFLNTPRPLISSAPAAYSGARSLPPSPTVSRQSMATTYGPTRSLSTSWEPPIHELPAIATGDSSAFLPTPVQMRTRRRFSPRSRLRASKRLTGHALPPWPRPVGLSLPSAVHAHTLLPRGSDRFTLQARDSEQYPRYQHGDWGEDTSREQYRALGSGLDAAGSEEKSSRYLREIDRRNILARIERGEKQSALAKEFHVTRAAICNLNKHRELIMTRTCDDPMAKHPKRAKPNSFEDCEEHLGRDENRSNSSTEKRASSSGAEERKPRASHLDRQVYVVDSRVVAMLRVLLHDPNTSEPAFQHHCARLMVCLIEEAVAWMYTRQPELRCLSSLEDDWNMAHNFMLDEYYTHRPPCGISMDEFGPLFLDKFRSIDPSWRCGAIEFPDASVSAPSGVPVRMDLPRAMPACNVFLLLSFARGGGCRRLHQSVRILIDHGVVEELLCLVALGISSRAVSLLHAEFPRLRVATALLELAEDDGGGVRQDRRPAEERTPTDRLARLAVSTDLM
jgi:hypothetical protein